MDERMTNAAPGERCCWCRQGDGGVTTPGSPRRPRAGGGGVRGPALLGVPAPPHSRTATSAAVAAALLSLRLGAHVASGTERVLRTYPSN